MGIEEVRQHLRRFEKEHEILEFEVSSATVELAAKALNTEENRIAKTLSFKKGEQPILVVTAGNMKIDNRKYKETYGCKANMLSPEEVKNRVGHEIGGVCPFGIRAGVEVYLDISLRNYDQIFPACGSSNSAIALTCQELEIFSGAKGWVDVCKEKDPVLNHSKTV